MNRKFPILLLFCLSISITASAQQITVVDEDTGEPVENVALFNQDRTVSTLTDRYGKTDIGDFGYSDSIYFQHPSFEMAGYKRQELASGPLRVTLEKRTIMMDEFVISALKTKEKRSEIPYMTDLIKLDKMFSSSHQTSAGILRETGNIMVQKSQGGGGSPVLRGFEANKILLVVDGVRMNNAIYRSGHLQNSITIDNLILDRVEILYGPSSIMYGSDALGGVIHYYTRNPRPDAEKVQVFSQFSSANRSKIVHADITLGNNRLSNITSVTISDFGDIRTGRNRKDSYGDWGLVNYFSRRVEGVDSTFVNPDPYIQKKTGYTQYDLLSKTVYNPSGKLDLTLNLQFSTSSEIDRFDQLNDFEGDHLKYAEWYYGPQTRLLSSLQGKYRKSNTYFTNMTTTLSLQKISEDRITRNFGVPEKLFQEEDVWVAGANFDFFKLLTKGRFYYGLEYIYNYVRSSARYENINSSEIRDALTRYPGGGNYTHSLAAYGNYKRKLGKNILINTGLRYQYGLLRSEFDDIHLPFENISINNGALTGSVGLVFNPGNKWRYNLVLATGFRNPNVDDYGKVRAKGDFVTVPNKNLDAEYTYNAEVSATKTFPGYVSLTGNLFYTYLTDAIVRTGYSLNGSDSLLYDGTTYRIITNSNANQAFINGISLRARSDLKGNFSFRGTLNFMNGKDITNDAPLGHIPPVFGRFTMDYTYRKLTAEGSFEYSGEKSWADLSPYGEDNEEEALDGVGYPAWHTLNLKSIYRINDRIQIQLSIENIFDKFYKSFASGVAAPGRNFIFTFRARI